jgi:hypothetical protein
VVAGGITPVEVSVTDAKALCAATGAATESTRVMACSPSKLYRHDWRGRKCTWAVALLTVSDKNAQAGEGLPNVFAHQPRVPRGALAGCMGKDVGQPAYHGIGTADHLPLLYNRATPRIG